jgi:hypothetical protein
MAPQDYRELCPNSGHVVPQGPCDAEPAHVAHCDACGRTVGVQAHPATGRKLLYSMHRMDGAARTARAVKDSR